VRDLTSRLAGLTGRREAQELERVFVRHPRRPPRKLGFADEAADSAGEAADGAGEAADGAGEAAGGAGEAAGGAGEAAGGAGEAAGGAGEAAGGACEAAGGREDGLGTAVSSVKRNAAPPERAAEAKLRSETVPNKRQPRSRDAWRRSSAGGIGTRVSMRDLVTGGLGKRGSLRDLLLPAQLRQGHARRLPSPPESQRTMGAISTQRTFAGMNFTELVARTFGAPAFGSYRFKNMTTDELDGALDEPLTSWRQLVIHPLSAFRKYFDLLLMLMVLFNVVVLPVRLAFYWNQRTSLALGHWSAWQWVDTAVDLLFVADIALTFNTAYLQDPDQVLVSDRRAIAVRYAQGWLAVDVLSSVPTDLVLALVSAAGHFDGSEADSASLGGLGRIVKALKLFKLVRLMRVTKLTRYLGKFEFLSNLSTFGSRILRLVAGMALFTHWNACVQFLASSANGFPERSWVWYAGLEGEPVFDQYTAAFAQAHHHLLSLGTTPQQSPVELPLELWVMMASTTIGMVLFLILGGVITTVLVQRDTLNADFTRQRAILNCFLLNEAVPLDLRMRIRRAHEFKWAAGKYAAEAEVLEMLGSDLKVEVALHLARDVIEEVPFLRKAEPGFVAALAIRLRSEIFLPGALIVRRGDVPDAMYFVKTGLVRVSVRGQAVSDLAVGTYFGEIGLLRNATRTADVMVVETAEVLRLSKEDFRELIDLFPEGKEYFRKVADVRLKVLSDALRGGSGRSASPLRPLPATMSVLPLSPPLGPAGAPQAPAAAAPEAGLPGAAPPPAALPHTASRLVGREVLPVVSQTDHLGVLRTQDTMMLQWTDEMVAQLEALQQGLPQLTEAVQRTMRRGPGVPRRNPGLYNREEWEGRPSSGPRSARGSLGEAPKRFVPRLPPGRAERPPENRPAEDRPPGRPAPPVGGPPLGGERPGAEDAPDEAPLEVSWAEMSVEEVGSALEGMIQGVQEHLLALSRGASGLTEGSGPLRGGAPPGDLAPGRRAVPPDGGTGNAMPAPRSRLSAPHGASRLAGGPARAGEGAAPPGRSTAAVTPTGSDGRVWSEELSEEQSRRNDG